MKRVIASLLATSFLAASAVAEPIEDARVIADMQLAPSLLEANLKSTTEVLIGYLKNGFAEEGISISDDAASVFFEMFADTMIGALADVSREPLAEAYVLNLSPETLAAYRGFLETPAGQEVIVTQGVMVAELATIIDQVGMQFADPTMEMVLDDMAQGNFPDGTLKSTQHELRTVFGLVEDALVDDSL